MRRNLILSLELGFTTLGVDAVFVLCSDFVQVGSCRTSCAKMRYTVTNLLGKNLPLT